MTIHPLFAGFKGQNLHAVGHALGFAVHAESHLGDLPAALPEDQRGRLLPGGDLVGFHFAGGWESPSVHSLLFVRPLTALASLIWMAGLGDRWGELRPSYFHTGADVLADVEVAVYAASGAAAPVWPRLDPDDAQLFSEAFALLLDGFLVHSGNDQLPAEFFKAANDLGSARA